MNSIKLFLTTLIIIQFSILFGQTNVDSQELKSLIHWQNKKESILIKQNVNMDSIHEAKDYFDRNLALYTSDSLSSKDVKKDYLYFYKDKLSLKIDSLDNIINHSNRIEYAATFYSNMVYFGLSVSGKTGFHPALENSLTYYSKNGLYFNGEISFWKRLDTINLKSFGLGYSKSNNHFSFDISYQRMILQLGTAREKNDLKHCFDLNLGTDLNWFNLTLDANYLIGNNQLFTTATVAEFCKRGSSLFHPLSTWKLGFDIIGYAATDEVFFRTPKVIKNPKSKKANEKLFDYFGLEAYEFRAPFTYTIKKFSATLAANYAIPIGNQTGNRYVMKSELQTATPNQFPKQFYATLALSYDFLLNKKQ